MDVLAELPATPDADLMLCEAQGIAYQSDRTQIVVYDQAYYDKCAGYEGQEIELRITQARVDMVARHYQGEVLDIGIGSGAFVKARPQTFGLDVNPIAAEWLRRNDLWSTSVGTFGAVTFWDVLEHVPNPDIYLSRIDGFVFASIPVFDDLRAIRKSKHYRPGEHLTYFTRFGFKFYMQRHGFELLEENDHESQAGRDSIMSFAFKRVRWQQ